MEGMSDCGLRGVHLHSTEPLDRGQLMNHHRQDGPVARAHCVPCRARSPSHSEL